MVQAGHKGQKTGQGFYTWNQGKRLQSITSDLAGEPTGRVILPDWEIHNEVLGTIQQRLALAMINESQKCLDEQVVSEAWMVDLGMVLGTGFAPFRGGPMSCLETWGTSAVRERLKILEQTCGARFAAATGLEQESFSIPPAEIESPQNI
jgi:3-hydroxyacyl-CoA dehydrogenase/enoyl-CoA hydratase/3-hydroxybutyryl-CoA epimerase